MVKRVKVTSVVSGDNVFVDFQNLDDPPEIFGVQPKIVVSEPQGHLSEDPWYILNMRLGGHSYTSPVPTRVDSAESTESK